jgi:hypothetical protein
LYIRGVKAVRVTVSPAQIRESELEIYTWALDESEKSSQNIVM